MLVLACTALTLAALLYVFWLTPEPLRAKTPAEREREYLEEKREVLYENLRDLHLEYRMGKLSDQDYQQTQARYQEEMAALLHQLEHLSLSAAQAAFVPGLPADLPADLSAVVPHSGTKAEARRAKAGRCPRCGQDNPASNRFCGTCGAKLPQPETTP